MSVSYTHLRAHETVLDLVCRLLLEKKRKFYALENLVITNFSLKGFIFSKNWKNKTSSIRNNVISGCTITVSVLQIFATRCQPLWSKLPIQYLGNWIAGKLNIQEIEYLGNWIFEILNFREIEIGEIKIREIEVRETEVREIEVPEIEIRKIEFKILIAYPNWRILILQLGHFRGALLNCLFYLEEGIS